jgi:hypothetical protein
LGLQVGQIKANLDNSSENDRTNRLIFSKQKQPASVGMKLPSKAGCWPVNEKAPVLFARAPNDSNLPDWRFMRFLFTHRQKARPPRQKNASPRVMPQIKMLL